MLPRLPLAVAAGSVVFALTIGYVMQYQLGPSQPMAMAKGTMTVTELTATSSAGIAATNPATRIAASVKPEPVSAKIAPPSSQDVTPQEAPPLASPAALDLQADNPTTSPLPQGCVAKLSATPTVSAMVNLHLDAACQPQTAVTVHHGGMMFTEVTDERGQLYVTVPVLVQEAVFVASFDTGDGAVAQTTVPAIKKIDRVAIQWQGATGLQLHALEFGASYFTEGHVWAQATGLPQRDNTGFLMQLGNPALPGAHLAEVYTFPSDSASKSGTVSLSVEAEVTQANCGRTVAAQTLQLQPGGPLTTQDLSFSLPGCDAVGEFLVLKNTVQDLKIATR